MWCVWGGGGVVVSVWVRCVGEGGCECAVYVVCVWCIVVCKCVCNVVYVVYVMIMLCA